jgi:hypothetical protein
LNHPATKGWFPRPCFFGQSMKQEQKKKRILDTINVFFYVHVM